MGERFDGGAVLRYIPLTSISQDWRTPRAIYEILDAEFRFTFDPCPPNAVEDGLLIEWRSPTFVNPPFKGIERWVEKAWRMYKSGKTVVMLLPARTDTKWFHDYCLDATEIRFIKGRLKFEGAKWNAPFPSLVVVFMGSEEMPF